MKKAALLAILLLVLIALPSIGIARSPLEAQDLSIPSCPQLELNKLLSLNQAIKLLGVPLNYTINYDETSTGWHASFPQVELWVLGAADKHTFGLIARVIVSDPTHCTTRGIKLGSRETEVFAAYGQPDYTSVSSGLTWHRYFVPNSLQRIIFGIDADSRVTKIGYSLTAGGL